MSGKSPVQEEKPHYTPPKCIVDEDMFVNLPKVISITEQYRNVTNSMIGYRVGWAHPHRGGKFYVPNELYPFQKYPPYLSGPCYFITSDLLPRLLDLAQYVPPIQIEDSWVTGVLVRILNATLIPFDGATGKCRTAVHGDDKIYEAWQNLTEAFV